MNNDELAATQEVKAFELSKAEVVDVIRNMISEEVGRVGEADVVSSSDFSGWVDPLELESDGRPKILSRYSAEAWEWFALQDVTVADATVLIVFKWLDPATPPLKYVTLIPLGEWLKTDPRVVATVARLHMRALLDPCGRFEERGNGTGWRKRVARTWIDSGTVVVRNPPYLKRFSAADRQDRFERGW